MDFDRSFPSDSSGQTEPDEGGIHTIPDISVARTIAKGLRRDGHSRIIHQCIILIQDDKPAPPRTASPVKVSRAMYRHFSVAYQQLALYVAVYFEKEPAAKSVLAIASTGPYWRWMKVQPDQVPSLAFMNKYGHRMLDKQVVDPDDIADLILLSNFIKLFKTTESYELGKAPSDTALNKLRADEIVPLLRACSGFKPSRSQPLPPDNIPQPIHSAEEDRDEGMDLDYD